MILLHAYSPEPRYGDRQRETQDFLRSAEPILRRRGWTVRHLETPNDASYPSAYERAVLDLWGKDDLTVIEHDCVPTLSMLERMETCTHLMCTQAYRLPFLANTGPIPASVEEYYSGVDAETVKRIREAGAYWQVYESFMRVASERRRFAGGEQALAHRVAVEGAGPQWSRVDERWADYAGLGLTSFKREMQLKTPPDWARGTWSDLDTRISEFCHKRGMAFHVHFPEMKHNHPMEDGGGLPPASQVQEELEKFLSLLREDPPRVVLEIGVERGGTLARFAQAARDDALLIGVDINPPESVPVGVRQKLHLVRGDSHERSIWAQVRDILGGRSVDILFIDGDHFKMPLDFEDYSPFVRAGGIVAVHDIVHGPPQNVGTVPSDWKSLSYGKTALEIIKKPHQGGWGIGVLWK